MKLPREQVDFTLSMYYEGMGLTAICRYLKQKYNNCPSDSTVYNWLMRFTEKVIAAAKGDHPRVSDKWIATLTPVKVGTENVWFWDILDVKTRFLLASHVSKKLTSNHARKTFGLAIKKAGKTPRIVLTDQMVLYSKGLEINDSSEADRIRFREFTSSSSARFLQSYSSPLKTREIILRGFKNLKSARTIIRGWAVHYNHLRPDEIIQNNTPAYHAGIRTHIKTKLY
jgi:transposase-like protein